MRTRSLNHSTYKLQYHIVWGTKYRRKWLKPYVRTELRKSFKEILTKYPTLHSNITIADAVSKLKSNSSLHLQKHFKFIKEMYLDKDGIWSVGYFVSSIGMNEKQVQMYIKYQTQKEKPQTNRLF